MAEQAHTPGFYGLKRGTRNHAAHLIKSASGALASIKYCPFCPKPVEGVAKFTHVKRRGNGRGAGLAFGGRATSLLSAHIREAHPVELAAAIAKAEGRS